MKIPSKEWSRAVLLLYRNLLREGNSLKFTERDFYWRTIRKEFERERDEVEVKRIKEQYEKGMYFLKSKMGGLL